MLDGRVGEKTARKCDVPVLSVVFVEKDMDWAEGGGGERALFKGIFEGSLICTLYF